MSKDKEELQKLILDKLIEMDERQDRMEASFTKFVEISTDIKEISTDTKEISTGYKQMNEILESVIKKLDSL